MGGNGAQLFFVVIIDFVDAAFILGLVGCADHQPGFLTGALADAGAGIGLFGHGFGDDVAGPGQGIFHRRHVVVEIDCRDFGQVAFGQLLGQHGLGQRFQAALAGDGGAGAALGLVG